MADDFLLIAITPERPADDEALKIGMLLRSGVFDFVHLRHPAYDSATTGSILNAIPADLRPQVKLHDHHDLAADYDAGIHVNSRSDGPEVLPSGMPCSRSCHSLDEVAAMSARYDYVTLSPVFDSISKPGYQSGFKDIASLRGAISGRNVVALGGITPDRIAALRSAGFAGAAMLGAIPWDLSADKFMTEILNIERIKQPLNIQ